MGLGSFNYHSTVVKFNPCGFGFVGEKDTYNLSSLDLKFLQNRTTIPLVLDWAVGNETCQYTKRNLTSYACKAAVTIQGKALTTFALYLKRTNYDAPNLIDCVMCVDV